MGGRGADGVFLRCSARLYLPRGGWRNTALSAFTGGLGVTGAREGGACMPAHYCLRCYAAILRTTLPLCC